VSHAFPAEQCACGGAAACFEGHDALSFTENAPIVHGTLGIRVAKKDKERRFSHGSKREIDRLFYEHYDPHFLLNRAATAYFLSEEQGRSADVLRQNYQSLAPLVTDQYFNVLRTELHFLEMQQFEALFALILAQFSPLPHWVYLTEYTTREFKTAVERLLADDYAALTHGNVTDGRDFVTITVYAFQRPEGEEWDRNLDNHVWLLKRMGERYLKAGDEYNSYKHGVRVISGPTGWSLGDSENPIIDVKSEHSVSYLESQEDEESRTYRWVTKTLNPEESFIYLQYMHAMLDTIVNLRKAGLGDEAQHVHTHTIIDLDRNALLAFLLGEHTITMSL
jgi:hypothetical protein